MKKKVLILTDHSNHSSENSLYALALKMLGHEETHSVDIASRAIEINSAFFAGSDTAALFATKIGSDFGYRNNDHPLSKNFSEVDIATYDLVWLRLPPPLSKEVLAFLVLNFQLQLSSMSLVLFMKQGVKNFY